MNATLNKSIAILLVSLFMFLYLMPVTLSTGNIPGYVISGLLVVESVGYLYFLIYTIRSIVRGLK